MSRRNVSRREAFSNTEESIEQIANDIYGETATELDTGSVRATRLNINEVRADRTQPRRAIPASIGLHWDGNAEDVPELINRWYIIASDEAAFDIMEVIQGEASPEVEGRSALFASFIDLLRLAADIAAIGLTNPIQVMPADDGFLIESGERRWLAHHVLSLYLDESYGKVLAIRTSRAGWERTRAQASENTARRTLNAIGMARQLAKLIMSAREEFEEGVQYKSFSEMVRTGGCDRRWYAQVADGNVHRIPKGMGSKISDAMGLSKAQTSRYRNLLRLTSDEGLNDLLWVRADVEDWSERVFRDIATLPMGNLRQVVDKDAWELADLQALIEVPDTRSNTDTQSDQTSALPVAPTWVGKQVIINDRVPGVVTKQDNQDVWVLLADGEIKQVSQRNIKPWGDPHQPVGQALSGMRGISSDNTTSEGSREFRRISPHDARGVVERFATGTPSGIGETEYKVGHRVDDFNRPTTPDQPAKYDAETYYREKLTEEAKTQPVVRDERVIRLDTPAWSLLNHLRAIAKISKQHDAVNALDALNLLTETKIELWRAQGTLEDELKVFYQILDRLLGDTLHVFGGMFEVMLGDDDGHSE